MKKIVKLLRLSSKESFLKLRNIWQIDCSAIWNKIKITNFFLKHISWKSRIRWLREIIERLSSINLIEKIINNWELVETRKNITIEWNKSFIASYKIKHIIKDIEFFVILAEKDNKEIILISVFLNYLE